MTALSPKQVDYLANSTARVNLAEGSVRAAKTYASLVRWLTFIADDAPARGSLLMVGKSRDSLYRNVIEPLEVEPSLAAFSPYVSYRQGAPVARILGRNVHMMGAADAKAETKIRGMTLAGCLVDEVTTMPREFFRQLLARMSVQGSAMFGTTNPDAPRHWLRTEYLNRLGDLPDWRVWHFTMDDNPSLTEEYKASLRREYTGVWYRRYILGEWVAAEGGVYDMFDPDQHVLSASQLPGISEVLAMGLDYGTTHRTRAYLLGIGQHPSGEGEALYVLSEFAPDTATVGAHATMLQEWLRENRWTEPDLLAVDPAAAVMRQELFSRGLRPMRAHNSVLPGIQTVASLLASGRLFILDECTHLVEALPGYLWDSAASARGETKPVKVDDDEADALRYAIYTSRHLWRNRVPLALPILAEDGEGATME